MPRKTKAQNETELDAQSLAGKEALKEARDRWKKSGGDVKEWRCNDFIFENVEFVLRREEKTTAFTFTIAVRLGSKSSGFYVPAELIEMEGLTALPSVEEIARRVEEVCDLIRPKKIVAAYARLVRCFCFPEIEQMHEMTGWNA